jgi:SAM-dependent methyltransferase
MTNHIPEKSTIWKKGYISYRRLWLDACLEAYTAEMRGFVIDLGGKREKKRGSFHPPEEQARAWWYINLDPNASPNIFADVNQTPVSSGSVDCIICTEVLEHIPDPHACVNEIFRLLRNGGTVFVSVPFIYPIHADPFDFQRFTEDGLRNLFGDFSQVEIFQMGSYPGTLGMLIEIGIEGIPRKAIFPRIVRWSLRWVARWLCWYDLHIQSRDNPVWQKYTTGYFLKAIR